MYRRILSNPTCFLIRTRTLLIRPNFILYSKQFKHYTFIHIFIELRGTEELEANQQSTVPLSKRSQPRLMAGVNSSREKLQRWRNLTCLKRERAGAGLEGKIQETGCLNHSLYLTTSTELRGPSYARLEMCLVGCILHWQYQKNQICWLVFYLPNRN